MIYGMVGLYNFKKEFLARDEDLTLIMRFDQHQQDYENRVHHNITKTQVFS